jgi:CDP-glucose 4,6-dehydratase
MNLNDTYAGKKVVVSGHTGFKGSWLAFTLSWLGAEVYGFSINTPKDQHHAYHALGIKKRVSNISVINGDVRTDRYLKFIESAEPDYIFHLAAQAIVSKGFSNPVETISTNTFGVLNLLEFLRVQSAQISTVIITSDKCYKNSDGTVAFLEEDKLGGDDPYSASKAAAEILYQAYLSSFFRIAQKGVATARAGNVFGGGDRAEFRLIPDCIVNIFQSREVVLRMPTATRPWTHVHDVLKGYLLLGQALSKSPSEFMGSWNFASEEKMTVSEVANSLTKHLSPTLGKITIKTISNKISEHPILQLDASKAREFLNWNCKISLDESLNETVKWYLNQYMGKDMEVFSEYFLEASF